MSQARAAVTVSCLSTLARFQPEENPVPITPGESPDELRERLGIPREEVNLVFINREQAAWDTPLQDGDRVGYVPLVTGG